MSSQIIVLNAKGHETITSDLKRNALELMRQGYEFWTNINTEGGVALGEWVVAENVQEDMSLVALRPISGG